MIDAVNRALDARKLDIPAFTRAWPQQQLERLPARFRRPAARRYLARLSGESFAAANSELLETVETVQGLRVNVAGNEDELRAFAKARAEECARIEQAAKAPGRVMRWQFRRAVPGFDERRAKGARAALQAMERVALQNGIQPPDPERHTLAGRRARLLCAKWWRRAIRATVARHVEKAAITLGLVHRRAGLYASDETLARRAGQKRRNRALLEAIIAENELKQKYTLQELADLSTSNPELRRGELMTRLAGFDLLAIAAGHAAEFYTLTAPSKYHARDSISGRENPKFQHYTPRETQKYLCKVWARIRAALHRRGIGLYGFRVAEPHHDGTPHWHMVMFMKPRHVRTVREIMARYALAEDGDEAGADVHRFKAEAIDRSKGSAAGYLAKYIAKNIDGYGVGEDWEACQGKDDAKDSARRVDAWAACWGIRQFQQIGGAPVSVWRELRRLDADTLDGTGILKALVEAADKGGDKDLESGLSGWSMYVNLQGGPLPTVQRIKRRHKKTGAKLKDAFKVGYERAARCWRVGGLDEETGEILETGIYGEPLAPSVVGVDCWGVGEVKTRVHEWVLKRGGKAATPWSSVNNCTGGKDVHALSGVGASSHGRAHVGLGGFRGVGGAPSVRSDRQFL